MSLEESVAVALYTASFHRKPFWQWDELSEITRQAWYIQARAAINASEVWKKKNAKEEKK